MIDSSHPGSGPQRQFLNALAAGHLRLQCCAHCGQHQFPPRVLCLGCGESTPEWVEASGLGRVYSVSVVARDDALGGDYNVVLVDLDEGVRLMSTVVGATQAVTIGMRVKAQFEQKDDNRRLVFVPLEAPQ